MEYKKTAKSCIIKNQKQIIVHSKIANSSSSLNLQFDASSSQVDVLETMLKTLLKVPSTKRVTPKWQELCFFLQHNYTSKEGNRQIKKRKSK